jgi:hypothetical protein
LKFLLHNFSLLNVGIIVKKEEIVKSIFIVSLDFIFWVLILSYRILFYMKCIFMLEEIRKCLEEAHSLALFGHENID